MRIPQQAILLSSLFILPVFAQVAIEKVSFPPVTWDSRSSADYVTIQNGTAAPLLILITVNKDVNNPNSTGINIKNCGNTTHVNVGSSAICFTNDPMNPVTFSSDSGNVVSGVYQIKQP